MIDEGLNEHIIMQHITKISSTYYMQQRNAELMDPGRLCVVLAPIFL